MDKANSARGDNESSTLACLVQFHVLLQCAAPLCKPARRQGFLQKILLRVERCDEYRAAIASQAGRWATNPRARSNQNQTKALSDTAHVTSNPGWHRTQMPTAPHLSLNTDVIKELRYGTWPLTPRARSCSARMTCGCVHSGKPDDKTVSREEHTGAQRRELGTTASPAQHLLQVVQRQVDVPPLAPCGLR